MGFSVSSNVGFYSILRNTGAHLLACCAAASAREAGTIYRSHVTNSASLPMQIDPTVPLSLQFEIVPEDDPRNTIVGSSADACYEELLRAISAAT